MKRHVFAGCLVVREGTVLLVQESHPQARGLWSIPLGKIEPHETPEGAARRETREESGYDVRSEGQMVRLDIRGREFHSVEPYTEGTDALHVFRGCVIGGRLEAGKAILDAAWFTTDEAEALPLRGEWVRDILRLAFPPPLP
jgi:8-oxo-dGTP pyrophosphatase MutT (NUDIX family)